MSGFISSNIISGSVVNNNIDDNANISYSKMGNGNQQYSAQSFESTVNIYGKIYDIQPKSIQTTDATPTVIDSFTLTNNTNLVISALINGIKK